MITPDEFIKKYSGKTKGYPTDLDYAGECLSLVKLYIKARFGINPPPSGSNSAYGYWSNFPAPLGSVFEKVKNTPTGVPSPGDLPIWKPTSTNSFGHIDIFVSGDAKKFTGFDQNWEGKQAHLQDHDYKNVVGWLHPKKTEIVTTEPSVGKVYTQEEYDKVRLERDANWNSFQDEKTKHQQDLDDLSAAFGTDRGKSALVARAGVIESEKEIDRKNIANLQKELAAVKAENNEHIKRIDELQKAIEQQRLDNELKVSSLVDQLQVLKGKITQTQEKKTWLDQIISYFKRR